MPDFALLAEELKKPHVTKKLLWKEYIDTTKNTGLKPYSISQFNSLFTHYIKSQGLSLKQNHNPGEVLELDWSGSSIPLKSPFSDEKIQCHLFIAAFPFSSYFYAEAFVDEKVLNWTTAISHSLTFFGGVPIILRPDNCKTATIKADKYEPSLNEATIELAKYYNTVVIPARVRKPKDKNVVESSVGFVSRHIIAALRNQSFYNIDDLNKTVLKKVAELNSEPFTKKEGNRIELFLTREKPKLLPLPLKPFELFERLEAKVAPDYHIEFSKCFYSVHYSKRGSVVKVKASSTEVIIFDSMGFEIARHPRLFTKGAKHTLAEHLPEKHQDIIGWSGDYFRSQAKKVGPNTEKYIDKLLLSRDYEVQAFRLCKGVLSLKRKVGSTILDKACEEALDSGVLSYKGVKAIAEILNAQEYSIVEETTETITDGSELFFTHSKK